MPRGHGLVPLGDVGRGSATVESLPCQQFPGELLHIDAYCVFVFLHMIHMLYIYIHNIIYIYCIDYANCGYTMIYIYLD